MKLWTLLFCIAAAPALADPVEHNRAECGLVERDRVGSAFNPQLWLDRDLS